MDMMNNKIDQVMTDYFDEKVRPSYNMKKELEIKLELEYSRKQWKNVLKVLTGIGLYSIVLFAICQLFIGTTVSLFIMLGNMIFSIIGSCVISLAAKKEYIYKEAK